MKRVVICLVFLLLVACTPASPTPALVLPSLTPAPPTAIPPTATPSPAETATPSVTPSPTETPFPTEAPSPTETPSPTPEPLEVRFAVIGDFGMDNSAEADVAGVILAWQPDIILTTGDNNYPNGTAATMDANVGKYFHDYIYPYTGAYGSGAEVNHFFPTLGNHDWYTPGAQPYLDYFTLPGNERYYDFVEGPVHFFALDDDLNEPDGVGASSIQAAWLKQGLADSTSAWNIVYMHYPPYSSGFHGSIDWIQWPFAQWGADALLAGHDHLYERLLVDGIPYFTEGAGGGPLYGFPHVVTQSQFRYNATYGAMLVTVSETEMHFEFVNRAEELIDSYTVTKP
jgi:tartrate-resistant acid phosphatase type 5